MAMTKRIAHVLMGVCAVSAAAWPQGLVGDVMAGKLVNPKVGQWAWYDVTDTATSEHFAMRQAIVGKEEISKKPAFWLETEIVPTVGYKSVYKMLVTGPASDPKNVEKVILKQGIEPPKEVPISSRSKAPENDGEGNKPKRQSMGMENVETPSGVLQAERFHVVEGEQTTDVWINNEVKPTGIVRMRSPQGELVLRKFGEGGEYGQSALDKEAAPKEQATYPNVKVDVGASEKAQAGETKGDSP
jgi:hypothetical protein